MSILFGKLLALFEKLLALFGKLSALFGKPVEGQGEPLPKREGIRTCFNAGASPSVCLRITHAPWNHKSIPKGIPSSGKTTGSPRIPCQVSPNSRKDAPFTRIIHRCRSRRCRVSDVLLRPLPQKIHFDPALCSPANPIGRPVKKRVTRVMDVAGRVRGDIPFALDSDLFGGLDLVLVRVWFRPVFVYSN